MATQPRKMSEILKEMSELLLRNPGKVPSSEAAHVALFFAHVAWNESVGLVSAREGYRNVWETIEAENPELWNEFKSNDIDAMIDELVRYKRQHYPDDRRRILTCGIPDGKSGGMAERRRPGVDSLWEMRLYGLVRIGDRHGGDPLPARDPGPVPHQGREAGGGGRRRVGDEVASCTGERSTTQGDLEPERNSRWHARGRRR